MVKIEGRRIIRAPVQKVFQLVSRLDTAPRVTGLWLTADLVERKSNSLIVQYRGYFAGIPVESLQRAILHPPHRIEFRQSRGHLKALRGYYLFKPIEGDTEVALTLEAEVGIPLITEQAARLVLHQFVERSLEKFKLTAERDLPRFVRKAAEDGEKEPREPRVADDTRAAEIEPEAPTPYEEAPPRLPPAETPPRPPRQPRAVPPGPGTPPGSQAAPPEGQPDGRRRRRRRRRRRGKSRPQGQGGPPQGGQLPPAPS